MTLPSAEPISVSPFFIVRDLTQALAFYRDGLGFAVVFASPEPDPFFAIVQRSGVQLFLKEVGIAPIPNPERHPDARWDAFVYLTDPDALAAELGWRGVQLQTLCQDTADGLRGFELRDPDGHVLFCGRPLGRSSARAQAK